MDGTLPTIESLDDLVDALAYAERLHTRLAIAVAELADTGVWAADGSLSMPAWLRRHARMNHADALALLRRGRFLRRYDAVGAAAADGRLSAAQVHAIDTAVKQATAEILDATQHELVDRIVGESLEETVQVCAHWRERAEAIADPAPPKEREQSLSFRQLDDGTLVGKVVLQAPAAAQFKQAIGTANRWGGTTDLRSSPERRADALTDIMAFFNANHEHHGTPRHRPHVELHINLDHPDDLDPDAETDVEQRDDRGRSGEGVRREPCCGTTTDGVVLPAWATQELLCDSILNRVLHARSAVLDYGTAVKTVPRDLFRALVARDGGCRFPGCDRPVAWCHAHHIRFRAHQGPTEISNLVLLCSRHHRIVHRDHWQVVLHPDATLTVTSTNDRSHTSRPHPLFARPPSQPPLAA